MSLITENNHTHPSAVPAVDSSSDLTVTTEPCWVLYSTLGCHLCEQAKTVVWRAYKTILLTEIDIADSELLMSRYGCKIPVVAIYKTHPAHFSELPEAELAWPFDEAQLRMLAEHSLSC